MIHLKSKDWEIKNIDTVIFDKDGTFIDLHFFWGKITEMRAKEIIKHFSLNEDYFDKICKILGYSVKKKKMLSNGITAMYSRVKIIKIFTQKLKKLNIETSEDEIERIFDFVSCEFNKNLLNYTKPIVEAIDFIEKINNLGVNLGIVTSDSLVSTRLTLNNYHWGNYFKSVIGRESSNASKESGIPTLLALKELGANSENTIMIGDAPMDSISAKNAGIKKTILVASGQISIEKLKKNTPYVLNSLEELECLMI